MQLDWLGQEFRRLLPLLREVSQRVEIAVTRPSGRSYGDGALRVIRVIEDEDFLHLLLAYERYLPTHNSQKRGRKRG